MENEITEKQAFDLAGSALQGAGFKQVLILATRLDSADDAERIDKKELKKYGSHVFQAMDTATMLASLGSHIGQLIKEHPEEKEKVAHFLMKLIDAVIGDDLEAMN
ncbi:MAG: hypothetical protein LKE88_05205 [Acidaminococcus provencensis]|jgi:hypothetical protein|uniref:hypothetical protein n=1 Tax=Acidaminococcus provencensis TaxID=2058289 RepID=UPI0023F167AA|nr:hypothetical protein [Acidaminococcus provencensis]MCH4096024.1 hypothetical protein [Acidaminococcus provencensis]